MWQRHIYRCYQKALWFGHIHDCAKARYVEMYLFIYVAKTHYQCYQKVLWFGHIYKCVKAW